jgi:hypothetical protein
MDGSSHSRHDEDWFFFFVEHLVGTPKTKGCKPTFKCDPTPCKMKENQHKGSSWVERHHKDCFSQRKKGGK